MFHSTSICLVLRPYFCRDSVAYIWLLVPRVLFILLRVCYCYHDRFPFLWYTSSWTSGTLHNLGFNFSHCSTFLFTYDVPTYSCVSRDSTERFPHIVSRYFFSPLVTVPVAPMITGMTKHFIFHICWISVLRLLHFNFFGAPFCIIFLPNGIVTYYYYYIPAAIVICRNCDIFSKDCTVFCWLVIYILLIGLLLHFHGDSLVLFCTFGHLSCYPSLFNFAVFFMSLFQCNSILFNCCHAF